MILKTSLFSSQRHFTSLNSQLQVPQKQGFTTTSLNLLLKCFFIILRKVSAAHPHEKEMQLDLAQDLALSRKQHRSDADSQFCSALEADYILHF